MKPAPKIFIRLRYFVLVLFAICATVLSAWSQGVGINETGADPDASSMLDISSTDRGVLIPRLTLQQKNAIINPAQGLLIYQTDDSAGFWFYQNNAWRPLTISVGTGTGLTGGTIRHSGSIEIGNTGVNAGTYGVSDSIPQFTVNAQGQLVFAGNLPILEKDSVIGNEIADTANARGMLILNGNGTTSAPLTIGIMAGNSLDDVWMWNGTKWVSTPLPDEVDGIVGNEIVDTLNANGLITLYGSGTALDPYRIGVRSGNSINDVWHWNGSSWVAKPVIIPAEKDSVVGNEILDTANALGMLNRLGAGTAADPFTVGVNPGGASEDIWMWDGTKWALGQIIHPKEKDSVIGNEVVDTMNAYKFLELYGSGTAADPYKLGVLRGVNDGNVLTWNGSNWESMPIPVIPEIDGIIGNELADTQSTYGMLGRTGAGTTANPYKVTGVPGNQLNDVWFWNGSRWMPGQLPPEQDSAIGNEVSDTIPNGFIIIAGAGTTADPLKVGLKDGRRAGDVLKWDGAKWVSDTVIHHTLDQAYDQGGAGAGRNIIADAGAVLIEGTDGYTVTGTFRQGAGVGSPGAGVRSFFNPRTGAFRSGAVSGTQWDAANIGEFSFASGRNVIASADYAIAMGFRSIANRANAVAIGDSSVASNISSVAIGNRNIVSGVNSIGLGYSNFIKGQNTAGLGNLNTTEGAYSIALGRGNVTKGVNSIAMGHADTASGDYSFAFGRYSHSIGQSSIAMGFRTMTTNPYSVALGNYASAIADRSFALGSYVSTNNKNGSFILGDGSTTTVLKNDALNQFMARFDGGYVLYTSSDLSTYVSVDKNSSGWTVTSDRNVKENIEEIDGEEILDGIRNMSITEWNYKTSDTSVRFIGPMAQDFHRQFGLGGTDSLGINSIAIDGVNMAAVQALIKRTDELIEAKEELAAQEARIDELEKDLEELRNDIKATDRKKRKWFKRK